MVPVSFNTSDNALFRHKKFDTTDKIPVAVMVAVNILDDTTKKAP